MLQRVVGPKIASLYKSSFSKSVGTASKPSAMTKSISGKTIGRRTTRPKKPESTWNLSNDPENGDQGIYETLEDGHELLNVEKKPGEISITRFGELPVHELNDSGGIQKIQTFEIARTPALSSDLDLEAQKKLEHKQMGW